MKMKSIEIPFVFFAFLSLAISVLSGQSPTDFDEDGISDIIDSDDDNDLLPDGVEMLWAMNPLDPGDAVLDRDGDGLNALLEYATGGDPAVYDKAIQIDHNSNRLKVRELLNPKTVSIQLGWSDNLNEWERGDLSDARSSADNILRSFVSDWDSPLGMVREWNYFLRANSGSNFFRVEVDSISGLGPDELIVNGDFGQGTLSWEFLENTASGSYEVTNGEAVISLSSVGANSWEPQLVQDGVNIVDGAEYRLRFSAKAEAPRNMDVYLNTGPPLFRHIFRQDVALTTEMSDFTYTFTSSIRVRNARLDFNVGTTDENVTIDNVSLVLQPPHSLTIIRNSNSGIFEHAAGESVQIDANPPPEGEVFERWEFTPSVPPDVDSNSITANFNMLAHDVIAIAHYVPGQPQSLTVITESGTIVKEYTGGTTVQIDANVTPEGPTFKRWQFNPSNPYGVKVTDAVTSFVMPSHDLIATAQYWDSEFEALFGKLAIGINVDLAPPGGPIPRKNTYKPAYFDACKAAGFRSIRMFFSAWAPPELYKDIVEDALERDLPIVLCMWGKAAWISNPDPGMREFVRLWENYAEFFKDYPKELIFELLNEPSGIQWPNGLTDEKAIQYINAVIPAIRAIDADRIIGLSGPALNEAEELAQYVTPEHLTYELEDGTGFEEDTNLLGIVHMYYPYSFSHNTVSLQNIPGWRDEVTEALEFPRDWSRTYGKRVVLTEWGAFAPPLHTNNDFRTYLQFIYDTCVSFEIGSMYYSVGFNDDWNFTILHTRNGWNQVALDVLTGVEDPPVPPLD